METIEKEIEITGTGNKTFINRILGEMKNQFNKTEKKEVSSMLNNTANNTEPVDSLNDLDFSINNSSTPVIKLQHDSETVQNGNEELQPSELLPSHKIKEEEVSESSDKTLASDESIKEETQEAIEEKPRIVLTFRKPATNDAFTAKRKNEVNSGRRTLRAKMRIVEDTMILKRSPRRSSRDCNESVLQSAIARKEKSYNEANKPQRLTRQLKATPKILENLANAALKLEKTRTDKGRNGKGSDKKGYDYEEDDDQNMASEDCIQSESDVELDKGSNKKLKHKNNKNKHKAKKAKIVHNSSSKDSDSDHSSVQEGDLKNKSSQSGADDKVCRRSHRLSSRAKDETGNLDDSGELFEPSTAEQDLHFPDEPECTSVEAQLIASQLCLCIQQTHIHISNSEDDTVHCTAIDSIGDRLIGCNNLVNSGEVSMVRSSSRVPYMLLCELHRNRMIRHNCCPKCGLFCTQGRFVQCESNHQYHRDCQISIGDSEYCPHCGSPSPKHDVLINFHSLKKPVFLPIQKYHCTTAKMSFSQSQTQEINSNKDDNDVSVPIIHPNGINIDLSVNSLSDAKYDVEALYQTIKDDNLEKLAVVLGSRTFPLTTVERDDPVLHFAIQNGSLPAVHMLVMAGAELDALDKDQNTALACAILTLKNDVVRYLIKAGASITFKGTDGMTPLHLAAKCGNLVACELLWKASFEIKNYIDVPDDGGWTPLVWACEHGHFEAVKFLLGKGADPMLRDVEQNVALHWAAFGGNVNIAEMLLNYKSDVNAVNAQGDSPLHIGARQDMYNCILVLLARGASVRLVNKSDESALDCCKPFGDCHSAISLNVHLQSFASEIKSRPVILTNDMTKGREQNPIQCINEIDDAKLPDDFIYCNTNCITSNYVQIDYKTASTHTCLCEEKCSTLECLCCNNSLRCWYNEEGTLIDSFNFKDPPMLFECNQFCSCNAITCNNRLVQRGLTQRFQVFKTEKKGWGLSTLRTIKKGSFVCEYIGEIVSDLEADEREEDSYCFDLDSQEGRSFCIDAKKYGNLSRFINHSCDPNLVPIRVFIDHQDLRFPRIAFFAQKEILAREEVSFDYGDKFWTIKSKSFTCDCRSKNCKYSEDVVLTEDNVDKTVEEEMT